MQVCTDLHSMLCLIGMHENVTNLPYIALMLFSEGQLLSVPLLYIVWIY